MDEDIQARWKALIKKIKNVNKVQKNTVPPYNLSEH